MKCKMYLLALSAMALATGCSNDETTELNKGNAIDFSVTAGKLTRAEATTTNTIKEFKVWAFTQVGNEWKTYMDGTKVTKDNGKWTYTGTKFWPETDVDFFALSPADPQSGTISKPSAKDLNFQLTDYIVTDGKEDLLYAANIGEKKDAHKTAPVNINFRHALSQIVFKAKLTDNSSIDVDIAGITIEGIYNKANLFWSATTAPQLTEKNGKKDTELPQWGEWSEPKASINGKDDKADVKYTVFKDEANKKSLTKDANQIGENLFLLPQTLEPWLVMKDKEVTVAGTARLLINCKITDTATGIQLWPKEAEKYADVAISLDNPKNDPNRQPGTDDTDPKHDKWMQGKKYTYTLIFGEGAGYTPDPEGPDPDPVLVPIKFEVTVDEFQDGGEYDLNANNPANP
mgnify:CR=1 FL=1